MLFDKMKDGQICSAIHDPTASWKLINLFTAVNTRKSSFVRYLRMETFSFPILAVFVILCKAHATSGN